MRSATAMACRPPLPLSPIAANESRSGVVSQALGVSVARGRGRG